MVLNFGLATSFDNDCFEFYDPLNVSKSVWIVREISSQEVISCKVHKTNPKTNPSSFAIVLLNKTDCFEIYKNKKIGNHTIELDKENEIINDDATISTFEIRVHRGILGIYQKCIALYAENSSFENNGFYNDENKVFVWEVTSDSSVMNENEILVYKEFITKNKLRFLVVVVINTNQILTLKFSEKKELVGGKEVFLTDVPNIVLLKNKNPSEKSKLTPLQQKLAENYLNFLCKNEINEARMSLFINIGPCILFVCALFVAYLLYNLCQWYLNQKLLRNEQISSLIFSQQGINQILFHKVEVLSKQVKNETHYSSMYNYYAYIKEN